MLDVKEVLLKRVDLKGLLVEDLLVGLLKPKLEELVKDSSNTFDDMALALVYPVLEKAIIEFIDAKLAEVKA